MFAYSKTDLDKFDAIFEPNKNCICFYLEDENEQFVKFTLTEVNKVLEEVSNEIE